MENRQKGSSTILVVDDLDDNRTILRVWLEKRGYHVVEAADGQQAVEAALHERPALILMDISMPQVDGFAATSRIRQHPELRDVPIIAITAYSTLKIDAQHGDSLATEYIECITKPYDINHLGNLIDRLLHGGSW